MKAAREHRVPMSPRRVEIIEAMRESGTEGYVFPGPEPKEPLSSMAMLTLLRRMESGITVHGFRSSFRDWASETTGFPHEVCETALAHAIANQAEAAYRRGVLFEKRRKLMEACLLPGQRPCLQVVSAGANHNIEVGIVGREGMTGLPVLLGIEHSVYETFIQSAGNGWRIPTVALRAAIERSPNLRRSLLLYAHTLVTQMAYTALANGRYKIEERLARWLLMADDRADGGTIHLTHEFLALMLGARRASVTIALRDLQERRVLRAVRGPITIQDRPALEEAANGGYGVPEAEYRKVFGG